MPRIPKLALPLLALLVLGGCGGDRAPSTAEEEGVPAPGSPVGAAGSDATAAPAAPGDTSARAGSHP